MLVMLKDVSIAPVPTLYLEGKRYVGISALWTVDLGVLGEFSYFLNFLTERKLFNHNNGWDYISTSLYPQRCACFK